MAILAFILGFIPGLIWLAYLYKKDRIEPEPIKWVMLLFAAGALSVPLAVLIESSVQKGFGIFEINTIQDAAVASWVVAGIIEEGIKLAIVLALVYFRKGFDEPMDGIIYAGATALGFASAENVLYILKFGHEVIVVRSLFTTLGHLLFSSLWGYAIGRAKFSAKNRMSLMVKGFVLAAFFHGLYNFLIYTKILAAVSLYIVSGVLWRMMLKMVEGAEKDSPFNKCDNKEDKNKEILNPKS